ncbi:MAG TPA: hypothetical protein VLJ86_09935 [Ramlibacter sp.]|nr:hypothetical protein [Ramlibacter sp.]
MVMRSGGAAGHAQKISIVAAQYTVTDSKHVSSLRDVAQGSGDGGAAPVALARLNPTVLVSSSNSSSSTTLASHSTSEMAGPDTKGATTLGGAQVTSGRRRVVTPYHRHKALLADIRDSVRSPGALSASELLALLQRLGKGSVTLAPRHLLAQGNALFAALAITQFSAAQLNALGDAIFSNEAQLSARHSLAMAEAVVAALAGAHSAFEFRVGLFERGLQLVAAMLDASPADQLTAQVFDGWQTVDRIARSLARTPLPFAAADQKAFAAAAIEPLRDVRQRLGALCERVLERAVTELDADNARRARLAQLEAQLELAEARGKPV